MDKIKLTKSQKKILTIVGIVGLAFLVFIMFIYLPLRRNMNRLRSELQEIESEISHIKKAAGEGKSLEEAIIFLKSRLEALDAKFPEKEEIALRELAGLAGRIGIEVVSIRPQKKKVIQDIGGVPIKIKECFIQEMLVAMNLKAHYKTIAQFFKTLKDDLPVFVRLDSVRMSKTSDNPQIPLEIELNLDTYLISPEAK